MPQRPVFLHSGGAPPCCFMFLPARMTSSTNSNYWANTGAIFMNYLLTT